MSGTTKQELRPRSSVHLHHPGPEVLPLTSVTAVDLNLDGDAGLGLEGPVEYSTGGLLTVAVYSSLLTFLDTESAVKSGAMNRRQQFRQVRISAFEVCKQKALAVVAISAVLTLLPGLLPVASFAAVFGGAVMGVRIARAVLRALPDEQREELRRKAEALAIHIPGLSGPTPSAQAGVA